MKREIKFRGKRVDNGEWVYGYLKSKDEINHFYVKPETVGQFTGLKDKNGKEIYEGDIVKTTFKYQDSFKEDIATVEYDKINPCFVMSYKFNGNGHECHEYDFVSCSLRTNEIIGNIHDNPEILQ